MLGCSLRGYSLGCIKVMCNYVREINKKFHTGINICGYHENTSRISFVVMFCLIKKKIFNNFKVLFKRFCDFNIKFSEDKCIIRMPSDIRSVALKGTIFWPRGSLSLTYEKSQTFTI